MRFPLLTAASLISAFPISSTETLAADSKDFVLEIFLPHVEKGPGRHHLRLLIKT